MGSKLTSQTSSLDHIGTTTFSRRRSERHDSPEEAERSAGRRGGGGDFLFASMMLKSDKLPGMLRKNTRSPYVRRVASIREIQHLLRAQKQEQAVEVLKLLRKDLGLQGTSLNDILYKNAAFLNLVDPISHELLLSLAKDMQCPKRETDTLKSSDKICRQLIFHLTPHSKWARQSVPRRKSQACLKTILKKKLTGDVINLSSIPLSGRDVHRVAGYLQSNSVSVSTVDLSFTELQDESLRLLLPYLGSLAKLTTLALNGNCLTVGVLKDLTEVVKNPRQFPSLAWVDLGNNVDIFTVPQPLLVALRRRFSLRSSLPTIYEYNEAARTYCSHALESSVEEPCLYEEEGADGDEEDSLELEAWGIGDKVVSTNLARRYYAR